MASKEELEKRRAEEQLLQNFSKLKLGDIFDGVPKTISLNYCEILPEDDFNFNFKVQNNHLIVNLWATNYEEGIKFVSGYWAVLSATKNPHDKFNQHSRLINTIYLIIYLAWVFMIFSDPLGFLFHYVGIIGIVLSSCAYGYYWVLLLKWKKRISIRLEGNFNIIGFYLSDSEKKFVKGVFYSKELVSSVVGRIIFQCTLGSILLLMNLMCYIELSS